MSGYRAHIEWIAMNDDAEIGDDDTGYILTVCLTADLFNKSQTTVAKAVMACRKRNNR